LQVPEELYRLTESPDRHVRAFAIRKLWSLYRDRGITAEWKPSVPPQSTVGAVAAKKAAALIENRGSGPPARPAQPPDGPAELARFLRRILFEIPPGRSEAARPEEGEGIKVRLKPLPGRRGKLALGWGMR